MAQEAEDRRPVGVISKNATEQIRVDRTTFKGHELVDVRVWYQAAHDEYRPTGKGVCLRLELVPELVELLGQATADGEGACQ